ncbi:hypothetical protein OHC33_003657 [Knufia fluminis]|uniref:BTB domain-containing protein n=1 Tax=Knufia fluminis TaxID=191047 RepID=A0AAN8EGE5_9EURO|nr:hypothetical protein OHC33_003657 [Knufia fluminis]
MADPSTNPAVKSKHARKSTLVIPALPLGFPEKRIKTFSQPAAQDTDLQAPTSTYNEAEQASTAVPSDQTTSSVPTPATQEATDATSSSPVYESNLTDASVEAQDPQVEATRENGHVPDQEHQDPVETTTLSNGQANGIAPDEPLIAVEETKAAPLADAAAHDTTDTETATVIGRRKVRLAEDDTQSSEQEGSEEQHSSATGLTDYAGSVAESNLETVVDETQPPRRTSGLPHRKSEVAPEVLTNGFAHHPAHDNHISHTVNGSISSQPPVQPEPPVLFSMQDHLLFLASSKNFSDTVIQVNQVENLYQPSQHYAHSLILYRSEFMAKLIPDPDPATQVRVINLHPARNILPHAFEAALRFFYSDQVLTAQGLVPHINYQEKQAKAQTLEYLMSHWIAGVELGLAPIKARSFEMVKELIDWDLAELIAKEAQDLRARAVVLTDSYIQDEVRDVARLLSHMVSQLITERVKLGDFVLDVNSQTTILPTRFAPLEFNRSNNPALSGMVFGSLQSSTTSAPSTTSSASALMLNMDFADLSLLAANLAAIGPGYTASILRDVVQQREERRAHVISNKSIPNKQRLSDSEKWDAAGWKEYIDEHGQLKRERVGYLLPTRSR